MIFEDDKYRDFFLFLLFPLILALLCGDTVTLSNEDKFPERD